jgi:hypothetical protein
LAPAPPKPPVEYTLNTGSAHYFVITYSRGNPAFNNIPDLLADYHDKYYQTDELAQTNYMLGDSLDMIVVKTFSDSRRAQSYAVKQKSPQAPLSKLRGQVFTTFVISAENFPLFYKANNLEEYMAFYRKNYQK